ncbi:hypothetical protein [Flavobacterium psychrotrophum]|uniref:hypothetical protein n=1 Tax=Flavobacterium psychrotrophum TaxID=2294119 RepID=UPI000E311405|nr:hypothetical protein [Flavobacterium psychrotrophum]
MSNFSIKQIFSDSNANALLDRFYFEIETALPAVSVNTVLCLTGSAAAQLQGEAAKACNNIVMLTSNSDIFTFVQDKIGHAMANNGVMNFKKRTVIYFEQLVLEVWYQAEAIGIVLFNGVYMQEKTEINPILL